MVDLKIYNSKFKIQKFDVFGTILVVASRHCEVRSSPARYLTDKSTIIWWKADECNCIFDDANMNQSLFKKIIVYKVLISNLLNKNSFVFTRVNKIIIIFARTNHERKNGLL